MKNLLMLLILVLAPSVNANSYFAASLGNVVNSTIGQAGSVETSHRERSDLVMGLRMGYMQPSLSSLSFGGELGYNDLNSMVRLTKDNSVPAQTVETSYKADMFTLMGKVNYDISSAVSLNGGAGVALVQYKITETRQQLGNYNERTNSSFDKFQPIMSLGVNYELDENMDLGFMYTYVFSNSSGSDVANAMINGKQFQQNFEVLSVQLTYNF